MLLFYVKWGVLALIPAIVAIFVDWNRGLLVLATVVLLVVVLLGGWLGRLGTSYVITDRRILVRHGILARNERSTHIDRVQNVNLYQTAFQRMLDVGTLDFDTAGTDESESDFRFVGIQDPDRLRQRIDQEYRRRMDGVRDPAGAGPAPASPGTGG